MAMTRKFVALLAVAALAVSLAGCSEPKAQAATSAPEPLDTVTAVGDGKAAAAPDRARVDFTVSNLASDTKRALDDASKRADVVAKALRRAGVDKNDLQTSSVNMYPQYGRDGKVTGYQASLSLQAEVRDIAKTGALIAAGTNAGADSFSGPAFYLSKENAAHDRAIEAAVEDARRRAEIMAKAAGKSVGAVRAISEQQVVDAPQPLGWRADAKMAAESVPIEPGQLDARADVTVVFELR